jgi:hypothetical protein
MHRFDRCGELLREHENVIFGRHANAASGTAAERDQELRLRDTKRGRDALGWAGIGRNDDADDGGPGLRLAGGFDPVGLR